MHPLLKQLLPLLPFLGNAIDSGGAGRNLALDLLAQATPGNVEVVVGLQVDPKLWRRAEIASQAQSRVGCNGAPAENDIIDSRAGYLDCVGKLIDADAHGGQELIAQNLTRMHRRQAPTRMDIGEIDPPAVDLLALDGHGLHSSVIVDDFNVPRLTVSPNEANPPLIIDPNAVLALAIPMQNLEAIARWHT
jgi:hypothetical protein